MNNHKHLFPILDAMVRDTLSDMEADGEKVSCKSGCTNCCNLLVEISWEEASMLAEWIESQSESRRRHFTRKIEASAESARELFNSKRRTAHLSQPSRDYKNIPESLFDSYFMEETRPCPFLDKGRCAAYSARPAPCRLHFVSSSPKLCSNKSKDDSAYTVPKKIERLKQQTSAMIHAVTKDGRWGQLSIMVEAVLKSRQPPAIKAASLKAGKFRREMPLK